MHCCWVVCRAKQTGLARVTCMLQLQFALLVSAEVTQNFELSVCHNINLPNAIIDSQQHSMHLPYLVWFAIVFLRECKEKCTCFLQVPGSESMEYISEKYGYGSALEYTPWPYCRDMCTQLQRRSSGSTSWGCDFKLLMVLFNWGRICGRACFNCLLSKHTTRSTSNNLYLCWFHKGSCRLSCDERATRRNSCFFLQSWTLKKSFRNGTI